MKGLFQRWALRQQKTGEQRAIDRRNAERRALCVEFARNKGRQGAIIQRLAELNHEADIKGAIERIGFELEGIDRRVSIPRELPVCASQHEYFEKFCQREQRQVEMMRTALNPAFEHDHFPNDMKHFRREYCGKVKP